MKRNTNSSVFFFFFFVPPILKIPDSVVQMGAGSCVALIKRRVEYSTAASAQEGFGEKLQRSEIHTAVHSDQLRICQKQTSKQEQ